MSDTTRIQVRFPTPVARKIAKLAADDRRSLSDYVAILVEKALAAVEGGR